MFGIGKNKEKNENGEDSKGSKPSGVKELGVSGLEVSDGQIENNDTQTEMQGVDGLKKIRNMAENDDVAWTSYWVYTYLIKSVIWSVKPASEDKVDVENAEFIKEVIEDFSNGMTFNAFIGQVASMVRDGFSTFEIVAKMRNGINLKDLKLSSKYNDGRWGIQKLALRGQLTIKEGKWNDLEKGDWTAVTQVSPDGREIVIPREKIINFTTIENDANPEGISLMRGMYRNSRARRKLENIENIGHSRDTRGTMNFKVPAEITAQDADPDQKAMYNQVKKMAKLFHKDEESSLISPVIKDGNGKDLYEVEILNGGNGGNDIDVPIRRKMMSEAMTMFTDWLFLGHDSGGNRSLSADRMELMILVIESLLNSMKSTLDSVLITKLALWNNLNVSNGLPEFEFSSLRKDDLKMASEMIKNLSMAGQDFSDLETENYFRRNSKLPEKDEVTVQDKKGNM